MNLIKLLATSLLFLLSTKTYSQVFEWTGSSFFNHNESNMVSYIDFGEINLWGYVEITLTGTFSHQNTTGLYRRVYNIGYNHNPTYFYSNNSEVTSAIGPVADQWKLGDFEVNSSNHLVVPIYHLVSTQNTINVHIRGSNLVGLNPSIINITSAVTLPNDKKRDYNYISGKLSVGTSKADDDALLTVAGNITSKELKVKVNAGADFVFDKSYNLPKLDSVANYIKANQHLPGIPSANDMKTNGLEVGNFQIKLLQKIEELTLHLIEQSKIIKNQQSRLENQEKAIEKLKNRYE